MTNVTDAEAFEHYEDPTHRDPAPGPARRRRERTLTQHVPVRFPTETVEAVRELAKADGLSVSAWIRRAIDRARAGALFELDLFDFRSAGVGLLRSSEIAARLVPLDPLPGRIPLIGAAHSA